MSNKIQKLSPASLWRNFARLNAIPRASKKEERVIAFMKSFGEGLGLETIVDKVGNVIIRKPGTPGKEHRGVVALQSHLDMVHQKNAGTDFNFDTQGIDMYLDGDWVRAHGTTLGADNGIGVAAIMAVLESSDIPHPPLEALFTIDEETGMTGAKGLEGGLLKAGILLNLDTEDDREISIGCAGGVDVTAKGFYPREPLRGDWRAYILKISGLKGGHSGMDIHLGRANANKLMNRFLHNASHRFGDMLRIHRIDGGSLRNAIPRESFAVVCLPKGQKRVFKEYVGEYAKVISKEYKSTDPDLRFDFKKAEPVEKVMRLDFQRQLIRSIYACPNGIYRMSPDIPDLVQTSNNLARVLVGNGEYEMLCLTRGSVDSEKMDLASAVGSCFELLGAEVEQSGEYPGWAPNPKSPIIQLMDRVYQKMFNENPEIKACHAGLECGILGSHYPDMDMVSFGPNIKGAHSPDERVQVSSVQKFWSYFLEILGRL